MGGKSQPVGIEDLIERHHALLYRYAFRLSGSRADAEDLTQQTYLIAHQSLHQLRDPSKSKSWLCTILRHAFLRTARHRISTQTYPSGFEPEQASREQNYDEEAVQTALRQLPEEYRSAAILFYFQELSYKEISEALEAPLGTVMSRLSRARQQLRHLLEPHERLANSAPPIMRNSQPIAPAPSIPAFID